MRRAFGLDSVMRKRYFSNLAFCLAAGATSAVLAGDLLSHIPADCAGLIWINQPDATTHKYMTFLRTAVGMPRANVPQADPLAALGLRPGGWDGQSPVVIILSRGKGGNTHLTVGFRRANAERFEALGETQPDGSRVCELRGAEAPHGYGTRIGDFVFLSPDRTTLERIVAQGANDSFANHLTSEQRDRFRDSDVIAHVRIAPWKEGIERYLGIGAAFAKFASANQPEAETGMAVVDWLIDGIKDCIGQMEWMEVYARLDDAGLTLTHLHHFTADGSVAQYLARVRRYEGDVWAGLPDEPFFIAATMNWQVDGHDPVTRSMIERLFQCPTVRDKIDPKERKDYMNAISEWYASLRATSYSMGTGPRGLPFEIRGVYIFDDAEAGLKNLLKLQKANAKAAAVLLPGCGADAEFKTVTVAGREVQEMRIDLGKADPRVAQMAQTMYGRQARFQMATLDKQHVGYVLTSRPAGIQTLFDADQRPFCRNPQLGRLCRVSQGGAHLSVLIDVGRALALGPAMAAMMEPGAQADAPRRPKLPPVDAPGAMVAWSLKVGPRTARGELQMRHEDARQLGHVLSRIRATHRPTATAAPRPPDRPRQPRVPSRER